MSYQDDDGLFGRDMRHKPPRADLLTSRTWDGSHGRLAFSQMVRTRERNISEYAMATMGGVPKGYVIVNAQEVPYRKDTALMVAHNRVAIPVKEYAKNMHLTPHEQWELLNPQWAGTFFGMLGDDPYRSRRPTLEQAISQSMEDDCYDEFMRQFWLPEYDHRAALDRLERRMQNLQLEAESLYASMKSWNSKITKVVNDMTRQKLKWYHLHGYNVNEYLRELRYERDNMRENMLEAQRKADSIREYLKQMTF